MNLKQITERATLIGLTDPTDVELLRRVRTANIMAFAGIIILIPMGIVALRENQIVLMIMNISSALFLIANLIVLGIKKNFEAFSAIAIGFMTVFFAYLFVTGGSSNTGHLWSYTLPLFSMFVVGAKRGAIALSVLFLAVIGTIAFRAVWLPQSVLEPTFYIRFILSFSLTSVFAYSMETFRQRANEQLYMTIENLSATEHTLTETNADLLTEIENRKNAEEHLIVAKVEADAANRFKSEFLANMSHELRTPLNHIIGFSDLLADKQLGELNEKQLEFLSDISASSNHLLSLINDILDLSKIEAGKMQLTLSRIEVSGAIASGLNMVQDLANKHNIELNVQQDGGFTHFVGDERKIRQVLYNLLSNAVKFTPDDGTVTMHASEDDSGTVHFRVSDTGIGIDPSDIVRIFDSFEQIEGNSDRRFEGTGLGLSLTKKIIELHGGDITAHSEGVGRGATLSFSIPLLTIPGFNEVTA